VFFDHDYIDGNGQYPDALLLENDKIICDIRHAHDYTATVQDFAVGRAAQTFHLIPNEAVVHASSGTTYMAICWSIDYADFTNPLAPISLATQTHDWKLIIDINDPIILIDLQSHYGGQRLGDRGIYGPTVALRGFYSQSGDNGFGPCPLDVSPAEARGPPLPI
jgi:hypothetical protein